MCCWRIEKTLSNKFCADKKNTLFCWFLFEAFWRLGLHTVWLTRWRYYSENNHCWICPATLYHLLRLEYLKMRMKENIFMIQTNGTFWLGEDKKNAVKTLFKKISGRLRRYFSVMITIKTQLWDFIWVWFHFIETWLSIYLSVL